MIHDPARLHEISVTILFLENEEKAVERDSQQAIVSWLFEAIAVKVLAWIVLNDGVSTLFEGEEELDDSEASIVRIVIE